MTYGKGETTANKPISRRTRPSLDLFYSPEYIGDTPDLDTLRKARWIAESLRARPIPGVVIVRPEPLTAEQVQVVHDPQYVSALQTGDHLWLAETNGIPWQPGLWKSVCASAGGVVAAALSALRSGRHAGSLSSGIHHARAGEGGPLCTLNALAIATRVLLDRGARRVIIIDVDAHCGGGTYGIVRHWPGVVHLDVSVSDFDRYEPEPNTGSSLDVVTDAREYLPTLQNRLRALDKAEFDLLLLGAGVDCHEGNGGPQGMTFQLLAEREATIFGWAAARRLPVALCALGGYLSTSLDEEAVSRLHRLAIAAAALANGGEQLSLNRIMELASTQDGTEGFSFDATGRKSDAAFHAELLGPEEDDPFDFDGLEWIKLAPAARKRFSKERHAHPGRQAEFMQQCARDEENR